MKNTQCYSIPVCYPASLCAPASLLMSVSVSLSIFPSLSLSFTLPLSFSRGVRRFFFLEDRLWRNPGSFDFVTIQVCSCSWCIDKRGPIYLCGPNQSLSSSLVLRERSLFQNWTLLYSCYLGGILPECCGFPVTSFSEDVLRSCTEFLSFMVPWVIISCIPHPSSFYFWNELTFLL